MRISNMLPLALVAASGIASVSAEHGSKGLSLHHEKRTLSILCNLLPSLCSTSSSKYPSKTWNCGGSGTDGWSYDSNGKGLPSGYPSGWLYFGSSYGWGPPSGWGVPSSGYTFPSACNLNLFKWWAPASGSWIVPSGFSIPSFWAGLGWSQNNNGWPSQSWNCDGSGDDGEDYDWQGNECPDSYPQDGSFKWFGKSYGWQPKKGCSLPTSWKEPKGWSCTAKWWAPQASWQPYYRSSFVVPSWFGGKGWFLWPLSTFVPSGTGLDGWNRDHKGNSCPSSYPSSWLWFGSAKGWQPYKGWKCASNWTIPSGWNYNLCSWWAPSAGWSKPKGFTIPTFWFSLGFILRE